MASLTTTGGMQIAFDPASVVEVADHDDSTGEAVTCVYGVLPSLVHISETVAAFLARIGVAAKFCVLTRPNGFPVQVNGGSVSVVRAPLPDEYVAGVNSVVTVGGLAPQGFTETPAAAIAAINAHGGKL